MNDTIPFFAISGILILALFVGTAYFVAFALVGYETADIFTQRLGAQYENQEALPPGSLSPSMVFLVSTYEVVPAGEPTEFSWAVEAPEGGFALHTAIHFGRESHPAVFDLAVNPEESGYPNLTRDYLSGKFSLPNRFFASITFTEAGDYFMRVHAVVDSKNYWSPEYVVKAL